MPGGELFHHLDLEGAFDEPTAMFFAASVLLALEFLHSKVCACVRRAARMGAPTGKLRLPFFCGRLGTMGRHREQANVRCCALEGRQQEGTQTKLARCCVCSVVLHRALCTVT